MGSRRNWRGGKLSTLVVREDGGAGDGPRGPSRRYRVPVDHLPQHMQITSPLAASPSPQVVHLLQLMDKH